MLTYSEARNMMSRARQGRLKLANNTYLEERPGSIPELAGRPDYAIRLHGTDVVTLRSDGSAILNSDGWRTVTTKDRMNTYGPVAVFSKNYEWFIASRRPEGADFDGAVPYRDGIVIDADSAVRQ